MRRLGLFIAVMAVVHTLAFAAPQIPVTAVTEGGLASLPELADAVRQLDAAVTAGNGSDAGQKLAAIHDWKGRLSAQDLYFVSDYFLVRSYTLTREGKTAEGAVAARMAADISPDYPRAWAFLAERNFAVSTAEYGGWFNPLVRAATSYFADPLAKRVLGYNLIALAVFAVTMAFAAYIAATVAAFRQPLIRDIRRLFPMEADAKAAAIALMLLLLALATGMGWFAAVLAVPLLLAGYLTWQGRAVLMAFLVFFAAFPLMGVTAGKGIALLAGRDAGAANRFITGGFEPDDMKELEAALAKHPGDTRLMFMLGAMNRRLARYDAAEGYLKSAIQLDPKNIPALVEMGNLNFNRGEFRDAEIMYKNALGLAPSSFEGHYNLGAAYLEQFRTAESNAELDVVARLNGPRANAMIAAKENKFAPKVVSVRLGMSDFPASVETSADEAAAGLAKKASAFFLWDTTANAHFMLAGGAIIAFAAAIAFWGMFGLHIICPSCGATFMPMFSKAVKGVVKCNQCVAMGSPKKSGIFGLKDNKVRQILNYQTGRRDTANMLNFIMPGLGSVWYGSYAGGAMLLVLSASFWAPVIGWGALLLAGYRPAPWPVYAALLGAMALFYLVAVPLSMRRK